MTMTARPISLAEDRSVRVPPGYRVVGGYVPVFQVVHACRAMMAAGDVEAALRRALQLGDDQEHPAPFGEWVETDCGCRRFMILDGRHQHLSAIMRGKEELYVEWLELLPQVGATR